MKEDTKVQVERLLRQARSLVETASDLASRGVHTVAEIEKILDQLSGALDSAETPLTVLPGTPYSRFALPLEYEPSRDYSARYGYSQPVIPTLDEWFSVFADDYLAIVRDMQEHDTSQIPLLLDHERPASPAWIGGAICAFDSLALMTMIRRYEPATYLEIGSGITTRFARQAIRDSNLKTSIVSIDPEPRSEVDLICDLIVRDGLETCDLDMFSRLKPNDILFFDGSHRSFMNSDVTVFFIDVLPRLAPGVVVHIHDINLPWDYPESFKHWYWNEQYLLAVYLMQGMAHHRPLLPTAWVCRNQLTDSDVQRFPDLGSAEANLSWLGGGSMWFTKLP